MAGYIPYDLQYECQQVENNFKKNGDLSLFVRRIFEIQRRRENWSYGKYLLDLLKKFYQIPVCPCYHYLNLIHTKKVSNHDIEHYRCCCRRKIVEIADIYQEEDYILQESVRQSMETGIITRYQIPDLVSENQYYYLKDNFPKVIDEDQIPDERFMYEMNKYYGCISCHFMNYHHDIFNSNINHKEPYLNLYRLEAEIINMKK